MGRQVTDKSSGVYRTLAIREGTCMSMLGRDDGARYGMDLRRLPVGSGWSDDPALDDGLSLSRGAADSSDLPALVREDDDGGRLARGWKRERLRGIRGWKARAGAGFGSRQIPAGSGGSVEIDHPRAVICGEVASCLAVAFSPVTPRPFT